VVKKKRGTYAHISAVVFDALFSLRKHAKAITIPYHKQSWPILLLLTPVTENFPLNQTKLFFVWLQLRYILLFFGLLFYPLYENGEYLKLRPFFGIGLSFGSKTFIS